MTDGKSVLNVTFKTFLAHSGLHHTPTAQWGRWYRFQDGEINSFPRQKLRAYRRKAKFLCSHFALQFTTLYEISKLRMRVWGWADRKNQISGDLGDAPPPKNEAPHVFCGASSSHTTDHPLIFFVETSLCTLLKKYTMVAKYLHHSPHHSHHPIFQYYSVLLSLFLTAVTTPRGMGEMKILNNAVLGVLGFILSACEFSFKWYLTMCCLWSFLNTQSTSFSLQITTLHRFCLRRAQGWWI